MGDSKLRSNRRQTVSLFIAGACAAEDNHTMNKQRDLLPWILGGLSAATIAVAFAAVSTHRGASTAPASPVAAAPVVAQPAVLPPVATQALPPPSTAQVSAPAPVLDAVPDSATMPAQPQAGQIWECTTKGVKTFSNNPCGEKSTLLDVSPINTMSATPAVHYAHAYGPEPRYQSYPEQGAPADEEQYSDDYGSEAGGSSYTVIQGLVARRRPEHSHRPSPHHNSGHASAPARRY
jgi:hypothetical protein